MTRFFTLEQIQEGLILDVADCLAIEVGEIPFEEPIFCAGDSLEILDITFRIQKRFGVRVHLHSLLEGWQMEPSGQLSSTTVQKLIADFPQIDWRSRLASIKGEDPFELLTVGLLAEMVFYLQMQQHSDVADPEAVIG